MRRKPLRTVRGVSTAPHQSLADGGGPKQTKAGENLHTAGGAALTSSFRQTSLLPFSAHTVQYVGGAICIYLVRLRHRNKPSLPGYVQDIFDVEPGGPHHRMERVQKVWAWNDALVVCWKARCYRAHRKEALRWRRCRGTR